MQIKTPFYLGKDPKSDTYFFFAEKQGVGRFIKYVRYPFWDASPFVTSFVLAKPPDSILEEVELFANGQVAYQVTPKQGRKKEVVVRIETPNPTLEEVDGEADVNKSNNPSSSGQKPKLSRKPKSSRSEESEVSRLSRKGSQVKAVETTQDSPSTSTQSGRSGSSEGSGNGHQTGADSGFGDVRGLPGNELARDGGHLPPTKPSTRRVSVGRVVGTSGEEQRSLPDSPAGSSGERDRGSDVDGTGRSGVGTSGEPGLKPRRKRRTKLEMQKVRAAEAVARLVDVM